MTMKRTMSPTLIDDAEICLRRAQYRRTEELIAGTSINQLRGLGVHAGLESYYRSRMDDPTFVHAPVEWVEAFGLPAAYDKIAALIEQHEFEMTDDEKLDLVSDVGRALTHYFASESWWPAGFQVVGVEVPYLLQFSPTWLFKGYIDLVLQDADTGDVVVVDHKTSNRAWSGGREKAHKSTQSSHYPWAWKQLNPEQPLPTMAYDVLIIQKTQIRLDRRIVDPNQTQINAQMRRAIRYMQLFDMLDEAGGDYPASPGSQMCSQKYCSWWDICSFGAAFEGGDTNIK